MDFNKKIKMTKELNVADLGGEKVMIDFDSGKYFLIKGCGNEIWDMLKEAISPNEIIENLMKDYDVSKEDCARSVEDFLSKLKKYDFISEQ